MKDYEGLINRLRGRAEAYPVDVFPEVPIATIHAMSILQIPVATISAGMGRTFSSILKEAADAIEELSGEVKA